MTEQTDAAAPAARELRRFGGAVWEIVRRTGRGIRWYVTNLMGDRAYDAYVAHHRAHHPGAEPLTERQFWRQKMDDADRNPGARCC